MENSCENVNAKSKRKKASWKRTSRGLIMGIGNRLDSNYYCVYEKTKKINHDVYDEIDCGAEFELGLKN
jgi:DNA relaxase NicK